MKPKSHDHKITEYAVYNEKGEMIDVLQLNAKQAREYREANPTYSLEVIPDEDPAFFGEGEFDDILKANGYYD